MKTLFSQKANIVHCLLILSVITLTITTMSCSSARVAKTNFKTESGLIITDITLNDNGQIAMSGNKVQVHYVGTLMDGTKFDSSRDRGSPFKFTIGKGEVIKGWDEGIKGMRVGDIRTLTIPPHLGYGERKMGKIPANSTLIFEVELIKIVE